MSHATVWIRNGTWPTKPYNATLSIARSWVCSSRFVVVCVPTYLTYCSRCAWQHATSQIIFNTLIITLTKQYVLGCDLHESLFHVEWIPWLYLSKTEFTLSPCVHEPENTLTCQGVIPSSNWFNLPRWWTTFMTRWKRWWRQLDFLSRIRCFSSKSLPKGRSIHISRLRIFRISVPIDHSTFLKQNKHKLCQKPHHNGSWTSSLLDLKVRNCLKQKGTSQRCPSRSYQTFSSPRRL